MTGQIHQGRDLYFKGKILPINTYMITWTLFLDVVVFINILQCQVWSGNCKESFATLIYN